MSSRIETIDTEPTAGFWIFTWVQFRRCFRGRKVVALGVFLAILPVLALINLIEGSTLSSKELLGSVGDVYFTFVLPIVALFFGGPIIIEEIEQNTYIYLIVRPLKRYKIFLGKLLAAFGTTLLLVCTSLLLFLFLLLPNVKGDFDMASVVKIMGAVALGTAAYISLFAALATIFGRSLLPSILYYIIVELAFGFLPVIGYISIRIHLFNCIGFRPQASGTVEALLMTRLPIDEIGSSAILLIFTTIFISVGAVISTTREFK